MTPTPSIARLQAPTPRYTSYPTAPHFTEAVGAEQATEWMASLPDDATLSLYAHIPFCGALCWYCGCSTMVVNNPEPIASYMQSLLREMDTVADHLGRTRRRVIHIHWGGGSPNSLSPNEMVRLADRMHHHFEVSPEAEFAVEIDPRFMDADRAQALGRVGVNRVSIGVQDFNPEVQAAINRNQSYDTTRRVAEDLRHAGVGALNIDLVYGLPHQTTERLAHTVELALTLRPDRLAVFGYAHLPSRIHRQRLIADSALPGPQARLEQARMVADRLIDAGYVRIGLDHFALPHDPLAQRPVHRNFQGYTVDRADALIGLGASAISRLPQGHVQNAPRVGDYRRRIAATGLAGARGLAFSDDDHMRGHVIERLMCDLAFSKSAITARFGARAEPLMEIAQGLDDLVAEEWITRTPDGFQVSEAGRPFLRGVCARFDAYLERGAAVHAPAI